MQGDAGGCRRMQEVEHDEDVEITQDRVKERGSEAAWYRSLRIGPVRKPRRPDLNLSTSRPLQSPMPPGKCRIQNKGHHNNHQSNHPLPGIIIVIS